MTKYKQTQLKIKMKTDIFLILKNIKEFKKDFFKFFLEKSNKLIKSVKFM